MSSSGKGILGLLIALIIFLLAASAGWQYFKKTNGGSYGDDAQTAEMMDSQETTEQATEQANALLQETHSSGADVLANAKRAANIQKLTDRPLLGVRGVGNPDAPVQIQEFFSLTCNHCASFHTGAYQELKAKHIDTGNVYFIYQEFPLNGPALYGSMIARCMPEDRYASFIDLLLREQDKWAFSGDFKAALKQNAALAGMSGEDFEACFANKDLQKQIAANIQEASQVYEISSTPSFVINNGERVLHGGQTIEAFDAVVKEIMGE